MSLKFRSGDIVLFEMGEDGDFLGKCIAELTNSNITHSAMIYKNNTMIEMTDSGISVTPFHQGENGYKVHLLRFTPEVKFEPLLEAADFYINKHPKYDFASLFLLAGLLIFKKINLTTKLSEIIFKILSANCLMLDEIYQNLTGQCDNESMMCSQLVYQCYYDCGPDYRIKIHDGLLEKAQTGIRLYDYAISYTENTDVNCGKSQDKIESCDINVEFLAKELFEALSKENYVNQDKNTLSKECDILMPKVIEFLKKVKEILEVMKIDLPLPALFVTPADLFNHAENLKHYSTTSIIIEG